MNEALANDLINKFDLHPAPLEGVVYSFAAQELMDKERMRAFVDTYRPLMRAMDDKAVAAYFGGWFASVALALQYSVSVYTLEPVITLSNLYIHLISASGYCRVAFSIKEWRMIQGPNDAEARQAWLHNVLTSFYQDTAAPLLSSMSRECGLGLGDIWGQLPSKFNYYIEMLVAADNDPVLQRRLQEDYSCLKNLPAEVFGLSKNPLCVTVRRIQTLDDSEQTVQMRNRCCQYYRTEGGSYCYTCPRLKEEDRAARRTEFRKQAASSQG